MGMGASSDRMAGIGGTDIVVVTVHVVGACADAIATGFRGSTGVVIIAGGGVIGMNTAVIGVAGVVGTEVRIVAIQGAPGDTAAIGTAVVYGTYIVVRARVGVGDKYAADRLVTGVVGADFPIKATQFIFARFTAAALTAVAYSADVAIVAGARRVGMTTTVHGIAPIEGAVVGIIAIRLRSRATGTQGADVVIGADVFIVAGMRVEAMRTACIGVTAVRSAQISIVTIEEARPGLAGSPQTAIARGTGVAVVAGYDVVGVNTAYGGFTPVGSA